ncbi:hypothetical protein GCM10027289_07080 [Tsukamurella serpentis]
MLASDAPGERNPQVAGLEKGMKTVSDARGGWRALVPRSKVTLALILLLVLIVVAWAFMR